MTDSDEERDLTYDEACLVFTHAIMMRALEANGLHEGMMHVMAQALTGHGFPGLKGAAILEGAFRLLKRFEEAAEILGMISIDEGKEGS